MKLKSHLIKLCCAAALCLSGSALAADTVVLYFSASGNTQAVAELIARTVNAESLAITPQEPYTAADLNWHDEKSRTSIEMKGNDKVRPAIANDLSAVKDASTVVLGFPIWWGTAPRIINTALESYDFSGKKIYIFCTSGGSGVEQSLADLKAAYPNYNFVAARRFNFGDTADNVKSWLK